MKISANRAAAFVAAALLAGAAYAWNEGGGE